MKAAVYVWQPTGVNPPDYPGVANNDTTLPIAEVWFKTHSGTTWMGEISGNSAAPIGTAQVKGLVGTYQRQGIGFVAWAEPTGHDIPTETALSVAVLDGMKAAGVRPRLYLDVEVESTPYFWKGTPAQLAELVAGIRRVHPDAELGLITYQYGSEFGMAQVAPLFDVLATMDYWNDFGTSPEARLAYSAQHLLPYDKRIIYGLPGNAPAAEVERALQWVKVNGSGDVCLWRRGTTSAAVWDTVRAFEMDPPPPPEPAPDTRDQLLSEIGEWLLHDAAGAALRQQRYNELRGVKS